MRLPEELLLSLSEVGLVTVELLAAVLLTVLGIEAELLALAELTGGPSIVAVWFVYMGAVALFGGVELLGRRRLLPRLVGALG